MEATAINRNLNDLPDEILLHILTFFPTLDAVQTSLISRKWRPLWSRLRFLKFSYEHFPLNDPPSDNRDFFAEFVDRALILRPHTPIELFSLSFIYHDRFGFHVDSWVRSAVRHLQARELHLDFFIHRDYHRTDETFNHKYDFPFCVLRDGAVAVLKLTRVDLTLPASVATMGLASLSSMYLDEVYLTDQMVRDLISGCPNLDELELQNCWGMEKLKICSKRLKKLALAYIYDPDSKNTVEIDCPNLCSLSFDNCSFTQFVLKFAPALVEFNVRLVRITEQDYVLWSRTVKLLEQAPYVKHLKLQNWWFKLLTSKDPLPKSVVLHNLNHLELRTGYTQCDLVGLAALLELSPNLATMILHYLRKNMENRIIPEEFVNKPDEFYMPSLKQVTMTSYTGTRDEDNFVSILKKHGVVLEKIIIHRIKVGEKSFSPVVVSKIPCKVQVQTGSSLLHRSS
ncbi:hypothetical protein M0R45_032986 [Rubus argutus]|uniref:F-box domain-containing protein n=1 Tax=Rubus argutus TaxID=59490 RepID=A0AAW1WJS3_RUBAR